MPEQYRSHRCEACGCQAVADVRTVEGRLVYDWHDPEPSCDCGCHDVWRIVHKRPATSKAA